MGRFDFTVGNAADRSGENFHSVGAGVQGERQQGAIHGVAEKRFEQWLRTDHRNAVDPAVANQQLDIQRRAAKDVGEQLNRPTQDAPARDAQDRQGQ
ncbi:hypothetical protein D3C79_865650 [compost metagenome]